MKTQLEIVPEWRDALSAAGLTSFDAFMKVRGGEPVSKHRYRETIPIDISLNGTLRRCYLKRVFWVPPKHAIWPLARLQQRSSQPWREWQNIAGLQSAGIPTMNRIAMGERRAWDGRPVDAFILVESVPESYTLAEWIVPGYVHPSEAAQVDFDRLFHALGACIGRLHANGYYWPDIHAKHIFAAPTVGTEMQDWTIRLIDIERMGRSNIDRHLRLDPEDRLAELDKLMNSLEPLIPSAAVLRSFDDGYLAATPEEGRETLAQWLESPTDPPHRPIRLPDNYVHPDRVKMHAADGVWMHADAIPALKSHGLDAIQSVFDYSNGMQMTKPGLAQHRERIRVDLDGTGNGMTAFLKRYHHPPPLQQIHRMWETRPKHSTAWREAHYIKVLGRMGISTMRCLAWGEEMHGRWEQRSFILTEAIKGESLERLAVRMSPSNFKEDRRQKLDIIEQLAAITARLHRTSLFHRDLYLSHVFLIHNHDGAVVLRLIDLARMVRQTPLRRRRVKDLASLDYSAPSPLVTRSDRLRFLRLYLRSYDVGASEAEIRARLRRLVGAVRRRTEWMARHDANRRRRLNIETTP